MGSAWLNMLSADLMYRSEPQRDTVIWLDTLSAPAMEVLVTIEVFGTQPYVDFDVLFEQLQQLEVESLLNTTQVVNDADGLLRCLILAIWYRGRDEGHLLELTSHLLAMSNVPARGRLATMGLVIWLRRMERQRRRETDEPYTQAEEAHLWAAIGESWRDAFMHASFTDSDIDDLFGIMELTNEDHDDLARSMIKAVRRVATCRDWDVVMAAALSSAAETPILCNAAALVLGFYYGSDCGPKDWREFLLAIPRVRTTTQLLFDRQHINLFRSPDITSENFPLALVNFPFGAGQLCATTAPGARQTQAQSDRGTYQVRRNLIVDVRHLASLGVTHVLSLLRSDELQDADMTGLPLVLLEQGLTWMYWPLPTEGEDETSEMALSAILPDLRAVLATGARIAVHASDWHGRLCDGIVRLLSELDSGADQNQIRTMVTKALQVAIDTDDTRWPI
jgi:hypothetical protein